VRSMVAGGAGLLPHVSFSPSLWPSLPERQSPLWTREPSSSGYHRGDHSQTCGISIPR